MPPEALDSFLSLLLGFAIAGVLTSGYQALLHRPAGFGLLTNRATPTALAAVPFLVLAAPFIIMRNTLRGTPDEGRRAEFVMIATVISGVWSLMSGTVIVGALQALGVLV